MTTHELAVRLEAAASALTDERSDVPRAVAEALAQLLATTARYSTPRDMQQLAALATAVLEDAPGARPRPVEVDG